MSAVDVLIDRPDFNADRRKRIRVMTVIETNDYEQPVVEPTLSRQQPVTAEQVRDHKRKRMAEICERTCVELGREIEINVNVELERIKRRKKLVAKRPVERRANDCRCEASEKKFDAEMVRKLIEVALETQKEKLLEPLIEDHLEFISQQQQYAESLQPHRDDFTYVN